MQTFGRLLSLQSFRSRAERLSVIWILAEKLWTLDNPDAPIKSLKGFQRVSVAPGKTAKVTIDLAPESFEYYDGDDGLEIKPGKYQILYGNSSADADLKALDFEVK